MKVALHGSLLRFGVLCWIVPFLLHAQMSEVPVVIGETPHGLVAQDPFSGTTRIAVPGKIRRFVANDAHVAVQTDGGLYSYNLRTGERHRYSAKRAKAFEISKNYVAAVFEDGIYAASLANGAWWKVSPASPESLLLSGPYVVGYGGNEVVACHIHLDRCIGDRFPSKIRKATLSDRLLVVQTDLYASAVNLDTGRWQRLSLDSTGSFAISRLDVSQSGIPFWVGKAIGRMLEILSDYCGIHGASTVGGVVPPVLDVERVLYRGPRDAPRSDSIPLGYVAFRNIANPVTAGSSPAWHFLGLQGQSFGYYAFQPSGTGGLGPDPIGYGRWMQFYSLVPGPEGVSSIDEYSISASPRQARIYRYRCGGVAVADEHALWRCFDRQFALPVVARYGCFPRGL